MFTLAPASNDAPRVIPLMKEGGRMRMIGVLLLFPEWAGAANPAELTAGARHRAGVRCASHRREVSIRAADNEVLRYQFDSQDLRRARRPADRGIAPRTRRKSRSALGPPAGIPAALCANDSRDSACAAAAAARRQGRYRAYNPATEPVLPSGNVTYSGVVSRLNGERVVLHTREAGDLSILLRKDTRFLEDGQHGGRGKAEDRPCAFSCAPAKTSTSRWRRTR